MVNTWDTPYPTIMGSDTSLSPWPTVTSSGKELNLREEFRRLLYGAPDEEAKGQIGMLRRMRRDSSNNPIPCPCRNTITDEPDKDFVCRTCLTADALITTKSGYKTIDSVLVGDHVLAKDGKFHRVTDKITKFSSEIISIKTRLRTESLNMTPDHTVFVIRQQDYLDNQFIVKEVLAEELQLGDLLILPKRKILKDTKILYVDWERYKKLHGVDPTKNLPDEIVLTDELLWTIGLWIAEGSIDGDRVLVFTLHIKEESFAMRVDNAIKQAFGDISISHELKQEHNVRTIRIYNAAVARWFAEICGQGCENKYIPLFVNELSRERALKLVEGIWAGDGCLHIDKDRTRSRYSIGMTARKTIYQTQEILWSCGYRAGLSTHKTREKRRVYCLEWVAERGKPTKQFYEFNDFWATAITSIVYNDSLSVPVYDLTVEQESSFVANNILVHNCSGMGKLWDEREIVYYIDSDSMRKYGEALFYLEYTVWPMDGDYIVPVMRSLEGTPVRPVTRETSIYKVKQATPFRSDSGRIEYWRCRTDEERNWSVYHGVASRQHSPSS